MSDPLPPPAPLSSFAAALLARHASAALPRVVSRFVEGRIANDPRWRAAYDALRRAERAASSSPLSRGQKDLLKARVLDAVAAEAASAPSRALRFAAPLAAAAVVAVVVLVLPRDTDDLVARGDGSTGAGLRVLCLDGAATRVIAEAASGTLTHITASRLTCPDDAVLSFSTTTRGATPLTLSLVVVEQDHARVVYTSPSPLAPSVDAPLDVALPLRGRARFAVFALFSETPATSAVVDGLLATAARQGIDLSRAARLPIDAVAQARVDVDVTPAEARTP